MKQTCIGQAGDTVSSAIEIKHLTKRHAHRAVVNDVSFRAQAGRVTAFLGPNGAGKSSTLRILLGLDRADAGTATIYGKAYRDLECPMRVVGFTMDGPAASKGRSARNHLKWVAMAAGVPARRVDEVLALTGLEAVAGKRVGEFSLGMGQRLGLATALLGDPSVLVLDEPMNGLDPEGIRWMRGFLRQSASSGKAVLMSSHFMDEVEAVADDVVVIADGRVMAQGTLDEVRGSHHNLEDAFFAITESAGTDAHGEVGE